jgi:cytoskeletal protein CcmA (bactofilin family)
MRLKPTIRLVGNRTAPRAPLPTEPLPPIAEIPRAPGQAWVEERTRIAVGPGVHVSGRLVFREPVRIEGSFRGEVNSIDLVVISAEGSIEGRVRAPRLLVLGELRGDVIGAERLVLGPRARVVGRIEAIRLTVCEGAFLSGDVRMPSAMAEAQKQPHSA